MALCWYCGKVKGKRACPARSGELICSRCCGSKRRVEIRCPEDCVYLHGADAKWTSDTQQKDDARFLAHILELDERRASFALFVHHVLLHPAARPLATLGDEELSKVVEAALGTLQTRARGVLYSHPTSAPHLQPLSDWLVRVISERGSVKGAPQADDEVVLAAVKAIHEAVNDHRARGSGRERYVEVAGRVLRESMAGAPAIELPEELSQPSGSLILPP